jgi:hypothetical protein
MLRKITTMAAMLFVAVACAGRRGASANESIVVHAVNENYYDARIHAVYDGGQRRSLGTIAGNGGRTRAVIMWEPHSLVFEIVLVTQGSTYISQDVDVARGDSIEIRVPSNIGESGFFRRVSGKD